LTVYKGDIEYEIFLRDKSDQWITALEKALLNSYSEGAKDKTCQ